MQSVIDVRQPTVVGPTCFRDELNIPSNPLVKERGMAALRTQICIGQGFPLGRDADLSHQQEQARRRDHVISILTQRSKSAALMLGSLVSEVIRRLFVVRSEGDSQAQLCFLPGTKRNRIRRHSTQESTCPTNLAMSTTTSETRISEIFPDFCPES